VSERLANQVQAPFIVAIDGPAGAGKSTVARTLASRLGIAYLDTGAMYRAAGLLADRLGLEPPFDEEDGKVLVGSIRAGELEAEVRGPSLVLRVQHQEVDAQLRTPACAMLASAVSAVKTVREVLVAMQQTLGARAGGVVEGRDIGTVVFPDAALKVYLTASVEERATRRWQELVEDGQRVELEQVLEQQQRRDTADMTRAASPLQPAADATIVDTTGMTVDAVVEAIVLKLQHSLNKTLDSTTEDAVRSRNHGCKRRA